MLVDDKDQTRSILAYAFISKNVHWKHPMQAFHVLQLQNDIYNFFILESSFSITIDISLFCVKVSYFAGTTSQLL